MSCDEVRELLPEHLLGVLEPDPERAVSRHLRGCGACRAELASLGQGLATFARAAHQYDSDVGQSWALILARSPGLTGRVRVFLNSPSDRIQLRPLNFDSHGEASTWLVSSANLARYDHVRLVDQRGRTLASAPISSD